MKSDHLRHVSDGITKLDMKNWITLFSASYVRLSNTSWFQLTNLTVLCVISFLWTPVRLHLKKVKFILEDKFLGRHPSDLVEVPATLNTIYRPRLWPLTRLTEISVTTRFNIFSICSSVFDRNNETKQKKKEKKCRTLPLGNCSGIAFTMIFLLILLSASKNLYLPSFRFLQLFVIVCSP